MERSHKAFIIIDCLLDGLPLGLTNLISFTFCKNHRHQVKIFPQNKTTMAALTLSSNSMTIENNPSIVSLGLKSPMFRYTCFRQSKKPDDLKLSPNKPFNWDTAIITDVADVNPTVTGIDIKSIRTPEIINYSQLTCLKYIAVELFFNYVNGKTYTHK